jgi:hypothetical protein
MARLDGSISHLPKRLVPLFFLITSGCSVGEIETGQLKITYASGHIGQDIGNDEFEIEANAGDRFSGLLSQFGMGGLGYPYYSIAEYWAKAM